MALNANSSNAANTPSKASVSSANTSVTTSTSNTSTSINPPNASYIASKRAEAKRELLASWEAFTEGRADHCAEEVCAMGEVVYGYAEWTRSITQLGPIIPETQAAQELRREGGKTALIDSMMAFQEAGEESYYEQVIDLGVEFYGEEEWGIEVQRRMGEV